MVFLHRAHQFLAYYYKLMLVALLLAGACAGAIAVFYPNKAEACGFWGPCTIPVYLTSFTISPDPIYTGFGGPTVSWSSTPADFCVLYLPPGGAVTVPPSGSYVGADYGAGWHVYTIKCDNTGDADEGTTGFVNKGYTAQNCPTGWSPASQTSCNPPGPPVNDVTVDCGGVNELGCPGGTYNSTGQVTKPTSGTKYLAVRSSHAAKTGDSVIESAIVQLPNNNWSAGSITNPDQYPVSPGSYGNAQVARTTANGNTYSMPITSATPAGTYYFYPITATNFHAWNNYTSSPGGWQRMASITVVDPTPTVSVSAVGSPGEPSNTGTFNVTRTGSTASAQPVGFSIGTESGAATRCTASSRTSCATTTDYYLETGNSPGCVVASGSAVNFTIPAGASTCTIALTPIDNSTVESTETATMILNTSGGGYVLGTASAVHNISDNDSAYTCSGASNGGAIGTYPSCTCNNGGTYTPSNNSCGSAPYSCTNASNGGATGSYPSCTCNNTGSYTPSNNTCGNPSCSTASPGGASGTYPSCTCSNGGTYSPTNNTCSTGSFNFAVSVVDPTITKGSSGPLIVNAQRSAGSATLIMQYALSWTAGSAPAGVTEGGFSPQYCTPGTSMAECNRETLTVSGSATPGTYTGTVYYTDGTLSKTDVFSLTIQAPASFGFTLQPSSYTISATPGETVSNTIYAYATAGSGSVYGFSQSGLPAGYGASFGGGCTVTVSGCPTSMQITVPSNASPGTYYVSVYANGDGGTTGSTMFQIEVTNPQEGGGGDLLVNTQVIEDTGEPGTGRSSGYFTLTRTGGEYGVMLPQFMYFDITGTAQLGVDYEFGGESTCQSVSTTGAIIPQGSASCYIEIVPLDDTEEEPPQTITITITPFQNGYND